MPTRCPNLHNSRAMWIFLHPSVVLLAAAGAPDEDKRPSWAKEMNLFVGDSVRTICKRNMELWDNKEGKIVGLLSGKAKVEIATEGVTQGQVHLCDRRSTGSGCRGRAEAKGR